MEILTLLKSNIRHKKGSFKSIVILMLIISMAFTAIFSIKENCVNSINNALENVNAGDITICIPHRILSDELLNSVKNHSSVKDVIVKEVITSVGAEFEDFKDSNTWLIQNLNDEYNLLNEKLTGYADEVPPLKKGEIYTSQGTGSKLGFDIGDTIKIITIGGVKEYTVKGFIVEPVTGSANIGFKQVFISDEDFLALQEEAKEYESDTLSKDYRILQLYKADKNISDIQFKQQLNNDTKIIDFSFASLTKAQSFEYTNIFPDIILSVLLAFVVFLVAIVLIVMAHSISTSIEMEYTSLGVLKSQGFTENKIKMIFALQYLFAEILGAIFGVILALPLIKIFGNIFQPNLAIPTENNISLLPSFIFIISILGISALFILFATGKIGKISPIKAISGGKNDIWFNSRLNAPISKKALSISIAFRQFTANKRRYIGTMLIITILMFFMITMNVLGTSIDSKSAMESMGFRFSEVVLDYKKSVPDSQIEEIEAVMEKHTEIKNKYFSANMYMSLNGAEYSCGVYKNPDSMLMSDGRYPKYENEIAISDLLAEELNLKIGDKVTVSNKDLDLECIVTGIAINANDLGLNFSIPLECAKKLGITNVFYCGYSIKEPSKCFDIVDEVNEKFSDLLTATAYETDSSLDTYSSVVDAMSAVIYVISILFSLVVVTMFCKKAFLQERRDIGIYKSLGFTSKKLRLQFAVRFLIISIIGSVFGSLLSLFFTESILTMVFRMLGISSFNAQFTAVSFIIPVAIIIVSFFIFSYFASRKIKKVEIKELVIE